MEIILYSQGELKKLWWYEDINTAMVDQKGTAIRQIMWEGWVIQCQIDAGMRFGHYQLVIAVKSRMRPADISNQEMNEFNDMVDNLKSRKKAS